MNAHMGVEVSFHSFYTSLIDGGGGFYGPAASPLGIKIPVTIEYKTARATEPVWRFRKSKNPSIILK